MGVTEVRKTLSLSQNPSQPERIDMSQTPMTTEYLQSSLCTINHVLTKQSSFTQQAIAMSPIQTAKCEYMLCRKGTLAGHNPLNTSKTTPFTDEYSRDQIYPVTGGKSIPLQLLPLWSHLNNFDLQDQTRIHGAKETKWRQSSSATVDILETLLSPPSCEALNQGCHSFLMRARPCIP